jgi:hypothetical protein
MDLVTPLEIAAYGISFVTASHPDAVGHIRKTAGAESAILRPILPYAVVLVNGGSRRLLATTVGFSWNDPDGRSHMPIFAFGDFNRQDKQIGHGEGRVFVPQLDLNRSFRRRLNDAPNAESLSQYSDLIANVSDYLANVQNMRAFIDSVTIEGVGIVGPDKARRAREGFDRTSVY